MASCDYTNIDVWGGTTSLSAQRVAESGSERRMMMMMPMMMMMMMMMTFLVSCTVGSLSEMAVVDSLAGRGSSAPTARIRRRQCSSQVL